MFIQYDFVFYFNLQFLQVFDKIDTSEFVIQFLQRLDLFEMKNNTSERKHLWCKKKLKKRKYCSIFCTNPSSYAAKYGPF